MPVGETYVLDKFQRKVRVGDLIVYGHSGRYAGTRVGRVYRIYDDFHVMVYLVHEQEIGVWKKGRHAKPSNDIVRVDGPTTVPTLKELTNAD